MNEYNKKKYIFIINEYIIISVIFKNNIKLKIIFLNALKFVINISLLIRYVFIIYNIYIILISSKYFRNPINKFETYSFDNETIGIKINRTVIFYLNDKMINKFNSYINLCLRGKINKTINQSYPKPKISVILPLYNAQYYINYSLSSIQNQNMKDIEIIIIDDYSKDNTIIEVKKYMKWDKRIRLIRNKKNKQILYSKSIAALNAKAKYIIQLDQDDIFIRDDIFDIVYKESELNHLDLVQFRDIYLDKFQISNLTKVNTIRNHFIFKKDYNRTFEQNNHKLKSQMFLYGNIYLLWCLLIKADLYRKAVYHLWPLIINYKIIYYEDYIVTTIIIILCKKYKYLNNFGLIHLRHNNSAMYVNYDQYYIGILFCHYNIYNFHVKNHPIDIYILINYLKRYTKQYRNCSRLYPEFFSYNIKNIINNEYLTEKNFQYVKKEFKIRFKDFNKWISYSDIMDYSEHKKISDYQAICKNNTNETNKNISSIISKYKISIVVYCFEFKYLKLTLNSILNQKFIEFEIILIYDNYEKGNFSIIKEYIEKYHSITLIDNKSQKGFLYSYSLGVLASKGEYILILKSGESLTKNDTLSTLYSKLFNKSLDILEFNLLINDKEEFTNNSLRLYKCKHLQYDINITIFKNKNNKDEVGMESELVSNKLINSSLLKIIITKYKLSEYNNKIFSHFDDIILFLLLKEDVKFEHISDFGIIKYSKVFNKLYLNLFKNKEQKLSDSIFYINFLFDNSLDTFKAKRLVTNEFYSLLSVIYNKFNRNNKESKKLYLKLLECKYISKVEKKKIIFYYNSLINRN